MDKFALKSRTVWGLIIAALGVFAPLIGLDPESIVELDGLGGSALAATDEIITAVGLLYAWYGRMRASGQLYFFNR